jgi:hypothetical protein
MNTDDDLRAQLDAVRTELAAVRAKLDALVSARGQTMAGQVRCPGCGGQALLHLRAVLDRAHGANRKPFSIAQKGILFDRAIGQFEAYVCRGCGLVEWYVPDLTGVEVDGETIRELDGSAPEPGGPYR